MNVILRPYDKTLDYGFIISTWPKAIYYGGSDHKDDAVHDEWFKNKLEYVSVQLSRWDVRTAVDPEDPSFIFGYSVTAVRPKDRIVQFVYIKKGYRCQGLASLLCGPESVLNFTHADWTDLGKTIVETRKRRAEQNESNRSIISPSSENS